MLTMNCFTLIVDEPTLIIILFCVFLLTLLRFPRGDL